MLLPFLAGGFSPRSDIIFGHSESFWKSPTLQAGFLLQKKTVSARRSFGFSRRSAEGVCGRRVTPVGTTGG
jgi:hypothetical protein